MSEAEIFHQGEGLVLPAPLMFCQRQTEWNDGPSTQMEEMAFGVFVLQTQRCTNLYGGGDVGEGQAFEVGQKTGGDER